MGGGRGGGGMSGVTQQSYYVGLEYQPSLLWGMKMSAQHLHTRHEVVIQLTCWLEGWKPVITAAVAT